MDDDIPDEPLPVNLTSSTINRLEFKFSDSQPSLGAGHKYSVHKQRKKIQTLKQDFSRLHAIGQTKEPDSAELLKELHDSKQSEEFIT